MADRHSSVGNKSDTNGGEDDAGYSGHLLRAMDGGGDTASMSEKDDDQFSRPSVGSATDWPAGSYHGVDSNNNSNNSSNNNTVRRRCSGAIGVSHLSHMDTIARIHSDYKDSRTSTAGYYSVPDPANGGGGNGTNSRESNVVFQRAKKAKGGAWTDDDFDDDEDGDTHQSSSGLGGLLKRKAQRGCRAVRNRSGKDWLGVLLPASSWLLKYPWKENLLADVVAGLTVGVMVIPQSMSYAKLAGLPVQFGLYSSLVPIYAYAMFGSSRHLAVGPVALVSLLL
jgi:hypothetical protein